MKLRLPLLRLQPAVYATGGFGLLVGIFVGAAITAPLGWTLPERNAELLASTIGAMAAVFGAHLLQVWDASSRRCQILFAARELLERINGVAKPIAEETDEEQALLQFDLLADFVTIPKASLQHILPGVTASDTVIGHKCLTVSLHASQLLQAVATARKGKGGKHSIRLAAADLIDAINDVLDLIASSCGRQR